MVVVVPVILRPPPEYRNGRLRFDGMSAGRFEMSQLDLFLDGGIRGVVVVKDGRIEADGLGRGGRIGLRVIDDML